MRAMEGKNDLADGTGWTLVTGGGGFLGTAIVRRLVAEGRPVRSFSRSRHAALEALGVEQVEGDLADPAAVEGALRGCSVVFHVAAKAGIWGSRESFQRPNVTGTRNILLACRKLGVTRLVYTSSPSVVFDGEDMEGVDESVAYATRFTAFYPESKALAEREVLAANGPDLATVALRPHLIWGPGDPHIAPGLIERGRAGQLKRIGKFDHLVDFTYIENAAEAHLLAERRLSPGSPVAGRAYFITDGQPVLMWDFINRILAAAGVPPATRSVPPRLAYFAGWVLEAIHRRFSLKGEPRLTRFLAVELSTAHWFDIGAARRDLGYEPIVTREEGLVRLREWLSGRSTNLGAPAPVKRG